MWRLKLADIAVVIAGIPLIGLFIYAISYDGFKMLKKALINKSSNKDIN